MKKVIGFANKFYTLWDYDIVPNYKMDAYGKYHVASNEHKFYYIKNISSSLDKVKKLYPDVSIDMELRGTRSFSYNNDVELPNGYFWFGKYNGRMIDEVLDSDFQYCLWWSDNYNNSAAIYIKNHSTYITYWEQIAKEKQDIISSATKLEVGDTVDIEFTSNGYNADENYTECWVSGFYGELKVFVLSPGVKYVDGRYPYLMPLINGKYKRTRGKTFQVTVAEVMSVRLDDGVVTQCIKIS
jgi:hypothetical protein